MSFLAGAWVVDRFGDLESDAPTGEPAAESAPRTRPADPAPVPGSERALSRIEAKLDRLLLARSTAAADRPPNVLLIVSDTMDGHLLGFNDPSRAMTPNLDRFAAKSLNFENAISQAGWTSPSMMSLHTGLYPHQHGCGASKEACIRQLAPDVVTLAAVFRSRGYYTAAFVGKNKRWFEPVLGGFHHVEFSRVDSGVESIESVVELLAEPSEMPHFIFLHTFDPHVPWTPLVPPILPPEVMSWSVEARQQLSRSTPFESDVASRAQQMIYIREIEELDLRLNGLLALLDPGSGGLFRADRDIAVFTSDHGEEFLFQNGFVDHGRSPHIETTRVPLLFRIPGVAPGTVSAYVGNARIYPTLLELLGWPDPRTSETEVPASLSPYFTSDEAAVEQPSYVLSEAIFIDSKRVPGGSEFKTLVRHDGHKLIYDTRTEAIRLFDLEHDPTEEVDLAKEDSSRAIVAELLGELEARTDLHADFPVAEGEYRGRAVSVPLPE